MKNVQFKNNDGDLCFYHAVREVLQDIINESNKREVYAATISRDETIWCSKCQKERDRDEAL